MPFFQKPKGTEGESVRNRVIDIVRDSRSETIRLRTKNKILARWLTLVWQARHFVIFSLTILVLLAVSGLFSTQASVAEFYATSCLGGWQNVTGAEGPAEAVLGNQDSFTEENSAMLPGGSATQLFCGGFKGDVPERSIPKKFVLKLSWTMKGSGPSPVPLTTSTLVEVVSSTPPTASSTDMSTSTPPENTSSTEENISTSTNSAVASSTSGDASSSTDSIGDTTSSSTTMDTVSPPAPTPETTTVGVGEATIPTALISGEESSEITPTPTPEPTPAPAPESSTTPTPEPSPAAETTTPISSLFWAKFALAAETSSTVDVLSSSSLDILGSSTPTSTASTTATSTEIVASDAFLEILYTLDGVSWESIAKIDPGNWESAVLEIPSEKIGDWEDLSKVQIELRSLSSTGDVPTVYLDAVKLEVEYENLPEETLASGTVATVNSPTSTLDIATSSEVIKEKYSRTPSGQSISSPVTVNFSFSEWDKEMNFVDIYSKQQNYWWIEIDADTKGYSSPCYPSSTVSASVSFELPKGNYTSVTINAASDLENCQKLYGGMLRSKGPSYGEPGNGGQQIIFKVQ